MNLAGYRIRYGNCARQLSQSAPDRQSRHHQLRDREPACRNLLLRRHGLRRGRRRERVLGGRVEDDQLNDRRLLNAMAQDDLWRLAMSGYTDCTPTFAFESHSGTRLAAHAGHDGTMACTSSMTGRARRLPDVARRLRHVLAARCDRPRDGPRHARRLDADGPPDAQRRLRLAGRPARRREDLPGRHGHGLGAARRRRPATS